MADRYEFLPISKEDMEERGWYWYDFLLVTGDAYVDHPSFGIAVIARVLESAGMRVAILAEPDVKNAGAFLAMGKPRYAVMITAGNIDSMVSNYTVAKKRRHDDSYASGGRGGRRPDRASIVYARLAREAFGDLPVLLGGLEASLRRFAHYDYWEDRVRRPILFDAGADLVMFGMGEATVLEIARRFKAGQGVREMNDIRGTCVEIDSPDTCSYDFIECPSFEAVRGDKRAYAEAAMMQYNEQDAYAGRAILQRCEGRLMLQNPPPLPIETKEFDRVYELPYTRTFHPVYAQAGGVPAISEVEFSIIHNRGCFGACNFCSLAFHQGRVVSARSHDSVVREAEALTKREGFKGYIHDVGGPTANFRRPACAKQCKTGLCRDKRCLFPSACRAMDADHSDYLKLLRRLRRLEGVKKVFIRSGLRYDYMQAGKNEEFFSELVRYHVSGQLKVAPEHKSERVLYYMGKPPFSEYLKFRDKYFRLNQKYGMEQYLVPYLMSSHPGCELQDAVELAEYLNSVGYMPEQVQDFYPTPGTLSTAMYYTGLDPRTMEPVYVPRTPHEKAMQRALLQWRRPDKRALVLEALKAAGREDLIGYGKGCLVRPAAAPRDGRPATGKGKQAPPPEKRAARPAKKGKGWAKAKPRPGAKLKNGKKTKKQHG